MSTYEIIYSIVAVVFVIWQGPCFYKWHPREVDFCSTEYIKESLLNTSGSIIGWVAGYYLIFYRLNGFFDTFKPRVSDLVIFLIAFYGMNGQLPNIIINKLKLGK